MNYEELTRRTHSGPGTFISSLPTLVHLILEVDRDFIVTGRDHHHHPRSTEGWRVQITPRDPGSHCWGEMKLAFQPRLSLLLPAGWTSCSLQRVLPGAPQSQLAPAGTLSQTPRKVPERSFCANSTACGFSSHLYFIVEGVQRGRLTCRVAGWDPGPSSLGPAHGGGDSAPGLRGASSCSLRGACVFVSADVLGPSPCSVQLHLR